MRLSIFCFVAILFTPNFAFARGGGSGGDWSIGGYFGVVNASQDSMNLLQQRSNTRAGGITASQLTQAYEIAPFLTYRFSGTVFGVHFRPSYFYQRSDGKGTDGSYSYGVQGYTFFPMLRLYPLENEFMKFYMQIGIGYGQVKGTINEGQNGGTDRHVEFTSGAFGTALGLGAEFCFNPSNCLAIEGGYRYLNFTRNVASAASGDFSTAAGSLSQGAVGREVEVDASDLEVRMGGLMFMAGYAIWF